MKEIVEGEEGEEKRRRVMNNKTYTEFTNSILKRNVPKKDVKNLKKFGMRDYYKNFKKSGITMEYSDYSKIFEEISLFKKEIFYKTGVLHLPFNLGIFYLRRMEFKPGLKDGEVVYSAPIDWKRTLEYWYKNPQAKEEKKTIKINPCVKFISRFKKGKHRKTSNMYFYKGYLFRSHKKEINDRANKDYEPPVIDMYNFKKEN